MAKHYKAGDLVALGGPNNKPTRLILSANEDTVAFVHIHYVSNGLPNMGTAEFESGAGTVVGNILDFIPNDKT